MTENNQYATVSCQMNKDLIGDIDDQADEEHTDRSTIIRKACSEYCDGEE